MSRLERRLNQLGGPVNSVVTLDVENPCRGSSKNRLFQTCDFRKRVHECNAMLHYRIEHLRIFVHVTKIERREDRMELLELALGTLHVGIN